VFGYDAIGGELFLDYGDVEEKFVEGAESQMPASI